MDTPDQKTRNMMNEKKKKGSEEYPHCFGLLDNVFPMGKNGFRQSPERCMPCVYKTRCLRRAMAGPDGLKVRVEMVDRAHDAGWQGAFKRWSMRKSLAQQIKNIQIKGENK